MTKLTIKGQGDLETVLPELKKGMTIPVESVEQIVGEKQSTREYGLKLMGLALMIDRYLARKGIELSVRTYRGTIQILDDAHATVYQRGRFGSGLGVMWRAHRKMRAVDISKLTADEQRAHEGELLRQSRLLHAVKKEDAVLVLEQKSALPKMG